MFLARDEIGTLHPEVSTPFSFTVIPHSVSLSVWDVPSPIVLSTRFRIKVGVKCSGDCRLAGERFGILRPRRRTDRNRYAGR